MNEADQYFTSALSWADERVMAERKMRRWAWMVAGGAGAIATLLALALVLLVPLKSVQPYVISVDRQTGAVQVATTLAGGKLTENEAVIQSELANYVRTRETFDSTDLSVNYKRVQLRSSPEVRAAYIKMMAADNPASPLRQLTPGDTVQVRIKSVSLVAPGSALVRYDLDRSSAGGQISGSKAYVSAISFGFRNQPLRLEDRFDNPLGFAVTRYRRDAEGALE